MIWRWLRQFPKFLIAFAIIAAALAIFVIWKLQRSARETAAKIRPAQIEDTRARQEVVAAKHDRLILVDNDLYDSDDGKLIFSAWLKKGMPLRLFWQAEPKKLLAQYQNGFIRYHLEGSVDAELPNLPATAIADDFKWTVFSRGGDIYRADIDWQGMKLANERKITSIGQFNDQFFAANLLIGTERILIIRNLNKIVSVNMETGAVKPMDITLEMLAKRKSPDSKRVVGLENGKLYCYEIDTDRAQYHEVGRGAINDYQWLGNEKCVAIAAMKMVIIYDVQKNTLTELAALPIACNRIGDPSPDRRFFFCAGKGHGVLIDVEKRTAVEVPGGAGVTWIADDTFAFSREIQDSDLRGTWVQKVGEAEKRVFSEPFLVGKTGGLVMTVPSRDGIVFATKHGLSKMKPDGTEAAEIVKLPHPPEQAVGIETWSF